MNLADTLAAAGAVPWPALVRLECIRIALGHGYRPELGNPERSEKFADVVDELFALATAGLGFEVSNPGTPPSLPAAASEGGPFAGLPPEARSAKGGPVDGGKDRRPQRPQR